MGIEFKLFYISPVILSSLAGAYVIDPDLVCRRVTRLPSVAGFFSQSGTDYQSPMTNYSIVERPSEARFSANRGSITVNSKESDYYAERREDLYTENSANNIQPVDVDSRSNRRQCTNLVIVDINTYGSTGIYALGQEDSRRSAPVLASESENAQTAPKTLVKDAFPSEAQKPLKPTASKHKLPPPRVSSFKWKRPKKIVGIC
uniref:Uncharacterized protein n=1 Tax=Chenopodium quinoa TaxID=63459 RepID=A0A803LEF0_CHEQI